MRSPVFSPDGAFVAAGAVQGKIHVWNARTGESVLEIPGAARVYAVAYTPDGATLVTAAEDRVIRSWNAVTGEQIAATATA